MSIGFRSSEINSLKVGGIPSFWGALWVQNGKQWGKSLPKSAEIYLFGTCKTPLPGQKMRLPGEDGPGNLINRKNRFFYIEAIPKLFSQLRKKIKKMSKKNPRKNFEKSRDFFKISNSKSLKFEILKNLGFFVSDFSIFSRIFFSDVFF